MRTKHLCGVFLLAVLAATLSDLAVPLAAQELARFEKQVTEFTLANGMTFIVVERHAVPVVSFDIYADVGDANDPADKAGLAHMFEHMAFKGTPTVGSKDYAKEKEALAAVDAAYGALEAERRRGDQVDAQKVHQLEAAFRQAQDDAEQYVKSEEFTQAFEENGGVGLNAGTGYDSTVYTVSLPSNKLELWFSLESDEFLEPVLREFYKERDVVMEERRLRIDSRPLGLLIEEFLALAYNAHPYGRSAIGYHSDLEHLSRADAERFFQTHYTPQNLTAVLVGDVDPAEVRRLAETYFGRIPAGPAPEPIWIREPPQRGERRARVEAQSQPVLLLGYHKPDIRDPDDAVFDAVQDILAGGRTSRLYRSLVQDKKISAAAGGFPGFPGDKFPNLFVFYSFASPNHTNEENEKAMIAEIDRLRTELVTEEELERVKNRARAQLVAQLGSNSGLADQIAFYQVLTGDWRNLFRKLDAINKVTREDVQRVARTYFTEANRSVAVLAPPAPPAAASEPEESKP